MLKKSLVFVAVAGLFASACGESGENSEREEDSESTASSLSDVDQEYADALTKDFKDVVGKDADGIIEDKDFECYGEKMIQGITVDRLEELDITPEDIDSLQNNDAVTEDERKVSLDAALGCIGADKLLTTSIVSQGVEKKDAECLVGEVDAEGLMKSMEEAELEEDPEKVSEIFADIEKESDEAAKKCDIDYL